MVRHQAFSYLRFSSEKQKLGDSLRRQVKLAEEYAARHGLELDSHSYRDLGVSAFRGRNALEGSLGTFLKAVNEGIVPKNSYLLVESLDRLSRDLVRKALQLFLSIIDQGIVIVTLQDEKIYSQDKLDDISLIQSILIMSRAHEESMTKSKRVRAALEAKRKRGGIIAGRVPTWLSIVDGKFQINEARAGVVRRAYDMALAGMGITQICRAFNEAEVPRMHFAKLWTQGNMRLYLRNPAVIGHLVRKAVNKDVIETIEDYYPPIVPKEVFYAVQDGLTARHSSGNSNDPNHIANLFRGRSFCLYCGGRMRYYVRKSIPYVHCMTSLLHGKCSARSFPYRLAERAILKKLSQAPTFTGVFLINPQTEHASLMGKIKELESKQAKLVEMGLLAPNVEAIADQLATTQEELNALREKAERASHRFLSEEELFQSIRMFEEHEDLLEAGPTPELAELRRRLTVVLQRQITKVEFASMLSESPLRGDVDAFRNGRPSIFDNKGNIEFSHQPEFVALLTFREGEQRIVDVTGEISSSGMTQRRRRRTISQPIASMA